MNLAMESLLCILPRSIRNEVQAQASELLEIRLRAGKYVQYILKCQTITGSHRITQDDLLFIINTASQYSPWSAATISSGYITAVGGHRIGISGQTAMKDNNISTISRPMSLCIRIAKNFSGICRSVPLGVHNIILLGPPGSGKTTLLRDLIRTYSYQKQGSICVVDEREELFPIANGEYIFDPGNCTDILSGCPKSLGIMMALKSLGPTCIAVDEITDEKDCIALEQAGWCGVQLLATAHASNVSDLHKRKIYRSIWDKQLFTYAVVMSRDKSYTVERIET